jgi:hypothetical protein
MRLLDSGIDNALAELPALICPLGLKPSLLLAGSKLSDHLRLFLVDATAIGAAGLHQERPFGKYGPDLWIGRCVTSTISFIGGPYLHHLRYAVVRVS